MAAPRTARTTLALLLCSAALAGCGASDTTTVAQGSSAPPPPSEIVVVNHGLDTAPQDESKIIAPAGLKEDETTLVVESPPLQEGVPQPLVSETVVVETAAAPATEASRLAQLEKEVAALRADYNSMMPAFNGLITTNERIKTLLDQLEQKAGVAPAAVAPAPAAAAKPAEAAPVKAAPEPQAAATPAPTTGAVIVSGMRIGEHGDKTRLVLDASAGTEYKTDISDKILTITVPGVGWTGKDGVSGLKSPLVSGWTASAGAAGGVVLTVSLKATAKVVATEVLKGEGKAPTRIVIDIAAEKPAS